MLVTFSCVGRGGRGDFLGGLSGARGSPTETNNMVMRMRKVLIYLTYRTTFQGS